MTISDRLKALQNLDVGDKIDFEFPFFMLYVRSVTSESLTRFVLLQNVSALVIFKNIGKFLEKILKLAKEWRYPQALASELISQEAPTKGLSIFLYQFAQSISSGETVNDFIDRE